MKVHELIKQLQQLPKNHEISVALFDKPRGEAFLFAGDEVDSLVCENGNTAQITIYDGGN